MNYSHLRFWHSRALCLFMVLCSLITINAQTTTDNVYIKEGVTVEPGGDLQYFTVAIDNASDDYVAYQMDIYLPEGLELAYEEGEPLIFINNEDGFYPTNVRKVPYHSLNMNITAECIRLMCTEGSNRAFKSRSGAMFDVYVTALPYIKPGDAQIELKGVKLSNINATGVTIPSIVSNAVKVSNHSTVALTVNSKNKYGTCLLPFDAPLPAGVKAYSCGAVSGENLVLEEQASLVAYTPYIIYAENGCNTTLSGSVDATNYVTTATIGYLTGTTVTSEVSAGANYILQNQGEGVMFYKVGDTPFSLAPGKCWLTLPAELQGSARFRLDGTTGIENVKTEKKIAKTIYDIKGRCVKEMLPGKMYIVDGKKIIW